MSSPHPHRPEHYQPVTAPYQPGTEVNPVSLVMTGDMIEDNLMASKQEVNINKPPHTGMTSMMSGQHSQPELTETMTDDHPEHHHRPRPVKTQKPVLVSETPLMSNEADSEENTVPLVMIEDNAMMQGEELINAPESDEAMIEEIIVHEFKEVLNEVVNDAVGKIVMKKAGIVGKLKTAKQNLIGHDGEATARDPQQINVNPFCVNTSGVLVNVVSCPVCICQCDQDTFDDLGRGNCNSLNDGKNWCFLKKGSFCMDQKPSTRLEGRFWSREACSIGEQLRETEGL